MFTGIIHNVARVQFLRRSAHGCTLALDLSEMADEISLGDSVAVNGVCLTVADISGGTAHFDVSSETLDLSTLGALGSGDPVNVELALRAGDRFGGHFVAGHVDGTGTIRRMADAGAETRMRVEVSPDLAAQMIYKGSVAVDGISLTVAELGETFFEVSIIPHTLRATTLQHTKPGDRVNIECDMIGKWVAKLLRGEGAAPPKGGSLTIERLQEEGF